MRSVEFIGKAEGIKSHEISIKSLLERLNSTFSRLKGQKSFLQDQLSSLYAELAAAENDTDEDGEPNYGLIASIENQINQTSGELETTESEISQIFGELQRAQHEFVEVEEKKQQTLFEIQQRARTISQDASKASRMYGAYASIGNSLNQSFQARFDALAQAADILDGNVSTAGGQTSSGGGGSGSGGIRHGVAVTGVVGVTAAIASAGTIISSKPSNGDFGSRQISGFHSISGNYQYAKCDSMKHKGPSFSTSQKSKLHNTVIAIGNFKETANTALSTNQASRTAGDDVFGNVMSLEVRSSGKLTSEQTIHYSGGNSVMVSQNKKSILEKKSGKIQGKYQMNTPQTTEQMRKQMHPEEKKYITSGYKGTALGDSLIKEHPGNTPMERKQNLQLLSANDDISVQKVVSQKPTVVLDSKVALQESWVKLGGYNSGEGMKQIFTPNKDHSGAIHAGIYALLFTELENGAANSFARMRGFIHNSSENAPNEENSHEHANVNEKKKNIFKESLISKSENRFSILGLKTPGAIITDKFIGVVYSRIEAAESTTCALFSYALQNKMISIKEANSKEEFYDLDEKCLYLNIPADEFDEEGRGTGLFHESGHAVDHALGGETFLSNNKEFRNCLIKDCNKLIRKCKDDSDWKNKFMKLIKTSPDAYSVSDILEGLTEGRICGGYGHGVDYWKDDEFTVCNEAFAHFFEASMGASPKRLKYIKTIFPESYSKYLEMIRLFIAKQREELEHER